MANKIHPEQKVFCPNCGAPIFFIEGREFTYCQYCGYQVYRPDPKLGMKLRHEEVKMQFDDNKNARELEKVKIHSQYNKSVLSGMLKFIGMLILATILLMLFFY